MGSVCALMPYCIESAPKCLWHNSAPEKDVVIQSVTRATGGLVEIVTEYFIRNRTCDLLVTSRDAITFPSLNISTH